MARDSNGRDDRTGFGRGLGLQLTTEINSYGGNDNDENSATFWVGVVMDDKDDLMGGRVWVKLPGYSISGPDETEFPTWKGTAPDKRGSPDTKFNPLIRTNWILCSPIHSISGSDEFRADYTNDGRNSYSGNVNSFGDWSQPRIGDHVAVLMMGKDPSRSYYFGCLPKINQNSMYPGLSGISKDQFPDGDLKTKTASGANLPGYDSTAVPALPNDGYNTESNSTPSTNMNALTDSVDSKLDTPGGQLNGLTDQQFDDDFDDRDPPADGGESAPRAPVYGAAKNSVIGGHAYDGIRGSGSSSARRESPSYVTGRKSAGWTFDSEQFNGNTLGGNRFGDNSAKYRNVNTSGHQFVMDDHPDSQLVRLRSSSGSQILLHDTGKSPIIYMCTPKGNVWIELSDDGNIMIYGEESISLHSKKDINITADRSIHMEAGEGINQYSHKDIRITSGQDTQFAINGKCNLMVLGGMSQHVQGGYNLTVTGTYGVTVSEGFLWKGQSWTDCVSGNYISDCSGSRYFMSDGEASIEATKIWLNSGVTAEHKEPKEASLPKFPELTKKPGVPTTEDVEKNQRADKDKYLGSCVPQHQPWPGRTGVDTSGTNGAVTATPSTQPNELNSLRNAPGGSVGTVDPTSPSANVRNGAVSQTSEEPDVIYGSRVDETTLDYTTMMPEEVLNGLTDEPGQGHLNGEWEGLEYQTDLITETPEYNLNRYLAPGEIADAGGFSTTDQMEDYIKSNNGLSQSVIVDSTNTLEIGYGHKIELNETIGGVTFDAPTIQNFVQTGGENRLAYLSIDDANTLFKSDLSKVHTYLTDNITGSVTQQQFNALSSFVYHVGINQISSGGIATEVIKALNVGRTDIAVARISNYVYVDGVMDPNTVERRKDERELMGEFEQDITYGDFVPSTTLIQLGQFKVDPAIKQAIDDACTEFEVDPKFAYLMCSQLSGFDPTAMNARTKAQGLFMITAQAAAVYGISGLEDDAVSNARAGVNYIADAMAEFVTVNNRDATGLELYTSMFLGQNEGAQYAKILANNPTGDASVAVDSLVPGLSAQYKPLFFNSNGTDKTNADFVNYIGKVYAERIKTFA